MTNAASEGQIAGFRILAQIGKGAASDLYAVQDPRSKQVWALKHVSAETDKDHRFIEQIQREYEVGSKLDHQSIRGVWKLIKHRKRFRVQAVSLLLELVDAASLDQRLPKTQLDIVKLFHQVAAGLAHMHAKGFVHADLKPSNIMVTEQGSVKLIDLGQACPVGQVKSRIQGTPGYMAPEQAHRQAITERTDIYNFGATLYWVLVGEIMPTALPPKDNGSSLYSGALDPEMVEMPTPPHERKLGVHPLLSKLVIDCVQVQPDDRPRDMKSVADRLELISQLLESNDESSGSSDHDVLDED